MIRLGFGFNRFSCSLFQEHKISGGALVGLMAPLNPFGNALSAKHVSIWPDHRSPNLVHPRPRRFIRTEAKHGLQSLGRCAVLLGAHKPDLLRTPGTVQPSPAPRRMDTPMNAAVNRTIELLGPGDWQSRMTAEQEAVSRGNLSGEAERSSSGPMVPFWPLRAAPHQGTMNEPLRTVNEHQSCLLYTSPSPRDQRGSRMPSSA